MTDAEQVIADALRGWLPMSDMRNFATGEIAAALRAHPEAVRDLLPPDQVAVPVELARRWLVLALHARLKAATTSEQPS
jgi:hypothetical protein